MKTYETIPEEDVKVIRSSSQVKVWGRTKNYQISKDLKPIVTFETSVSADCVDNKAIWGTMEISFHTDNGDSVRFRLEPLKS